MCSVVVQPCGFPAPAAFRGVSGPQRQLHTLHLSSRTQQSCPEEKVLPQPLSVPAPPAGASGLLACSAGSLLGFPSVPRGAPHRCPCFSGGLVASSSGLSQHRSLHTLHLSPSGFVALPDITSCGWASGEQLCLCENVLISLCFLNNPRRIIHFL